MPCCSRTTARHTAPTLWFWRRLRARRGVSTAHPVPANRAEVLSRLADLPVHTWTYGFDHESVKHLGPMAQDFAAAFGLGDTDRQIFPLDGIGVCLAAIQALNDRVVQLNAELARSQRTEPVVSNPSVPLS